MIFFLKYVIYLILSKRLKSETHKFLPEKQLHTFCICSLCDYHGIDGGVGMVIQFFQKNGVIDPLAIHAGIYQFKIGRINDKEEEYLSLYIGESYSMIVRCSNHLYEVFHTDPTYFGLKSEHLENDKLKLIVEVYESVKIPDVMTYSDRDQLLCERELDAIKKRNPLSQLSTSDRLRKDRVKVVEDAINKLLEG